MKKQFTNFANFKIGILLFCIVFTSCIQGTNNNLENSGSSSAPTITTTKGYAENTALYLGNPSGATVSTEDEENYLMEKSTYALSYNNITHNPNWVSWHLCADDLGELKRLSSFGTDTSLPDGWYQVTQSDYSSATYSGNGMTRGHMCPNMDRNADSDAQKEVFLMTNMVPQTANNNNTVWAGLETQEVSWAKEGKELYIICGPYGKGGTYNPNGVTYDSSVWGNSTSIEYIEITNPYNNDDPGIVVPSSTWRVEIILDSTDNGDLDRITLDTTVIAINVPNTYECLFTSTGTKKSWTDYICTIDEIEELTGYDFFANLPDEIENALEAKTYSE